MAIFGALTIAERALCGACRAAEDAAEPEETDPHALGPIQFEVLRESLQIAEAHLSAMDRAPYPAFLRRMAAANGQTIPPDVQATLDTWNRESLGAVFSVLTGPRPELEEVPGMFGVARLAPEEAVPSWAQSSTFASITRTTRELSIIVAEERIPVGVRAERGLRCLGVVGALPFDAVGVMASVALPLALREISILALATFDTDYLLVPGSCFAEAIAALRDAGFAVRLVPGPAAE